MRMRSESSYQIKLLREDDTLTFTKRGPLLPFVLCTCLLIFVTALAAFVIGTPGSFGSGRTIVLALLLGLATVLVGIGGIGFYNFRTIRQIRLGRGSVSFAEVRPRLMLSPSSTTAWQESLDRYTGIEACVVTFKFSNSTRTTFKLILKHVDNVHRDVLVYSAANDVGFREEAEEIAQLLNLPILQGYFTETPVASLRKTLVEQVVGRSLVVPRLTGSFPPNGTVVVLQLPSSRIYSRQPLSRKAVAYLVAGSVAPLCAALFGSTVGGAERMQWDSLYLLISLLVSTVCLWVLLNRQRLRVQESGIELISTFSRLTMPYAQMVEVDVLPTGGRGYALRIASRDRRIEFRGPFSQADLRWVRDAVLFQLSEWSHQAQDEAQKSERQTH